MSNFKWVGQVIDKEDPRKFLRYVTARGGDLVASNGPMLLKAPNDLGLSDGMWENEVTVVKVGFDERVMPDYTTMFPIIPKKAWVLQSLNELETINNDGYIIVKIGGWWYRKDLIEMVTDSNGVFQSFECTSMLTSSQTLNIKPIKNDHGCENRCGIIVSFRTEGVYE